MKKILYTFLVILALSSFKNQAEANTKLVINIPKQNLSFCIKLFQKNKTLGTVCFIFQGSILGSEEIAKALGYRELSNYILELIEKSKEQNLEDLFTPKPKD